MSKQQDQDVPVKISRPDYTEVQEIRDLHGVSIKIVVGAAIHLLRSLPVEKQSKVIRESLREVTAA